MTQGPTLFPAPDHDHNRCAADGMGHAETVCERRGQRLTPMRRNVLNALLANHRPLGAYEIIDILAREMSRPAPITIYRALDFLMENGLVHRIASRNAYIACAHDHARDAQVAFLICDGCGTVGEMPIASIAHLLTDAMRQAGFTPTLSVVEISGLCARCQSEPRPPQED